MKKLLCALLLCALCACALCGCGRRAPSAGDAPSAPADAGETPIPEEGEHGEEDQSKALEALPTVPPLEPADGDALGDNGASPEDYYSMDALLNDSGNEGGDSLDFDAPAENPMPEDDRSAASAIDPSSYQFSALTDTTLGFTFNYPSHWVNIPGVYTVCFREAVEPGDFPARVAICAKRLVHSPEGTVLTDELTEFVRTIRKQYDAKTFQLGSPNAQDTFLGREAVSNTYLAFSGETEVKGFVIGCTVGRRLYVFHFCASYEDYAGMESLMRYMLKSVELVEDD